MSIRIPIGNARPITASVIYDAFRQYPEVKSIHVGFTKETDKSGQNPLERWLVVDIPKEN